MTDQTELDSVISPEMLAKWQNVVEILAHTLSMKSVLVTRVELPDMIEVLRSSKTPGNPYPAGLRAPLAGLFCERVLTSGERLLLPDARTDPEWRDAPEIDHGIYSYLGYPIRWPDGTPFGTICLMDDRANAFAGDHDALLAGFRDLVEAHLALLREREDLRKAMREVRRLREILPICSSCKKIRTEDGRWEPMEEYFRANAQTDFSHSFCPDCAEQYYPGLKNAPCSDG